MHQEIPELSTKPYKAQGMAMFVRVCVCVRVFFVNSVQLLESGMTVSFTTTEV